jgi:DNA repair protein RecO (recombination protein O)
MGLKKDHGIVLRGYPFGDADRVVVILSPNHGKLRTVAKGIRKTKSRFGGRLEPFTHVELGLYEGRNLDTITSVSVLEAFPRLREDLDLVVKGGTMLEAADAIAVEGEGSHRLFLLVQRGLRALNLENSHPDLVASFLLKAAEVVGVAPSLMQCASCGKPGEHALFSFPAGGALCSSCGQSGAARLRPGLTSYLAALAESRFEELPEPIAAMSGDAMGVTRRFVEYHLDRQLHSLSLLDD